MERLRSGRQVTCPGHSRARSFLGRSLKLKLAGWLFVSNRWCSGREDILCSLLQTAFLIRGRYFSIVHPIRLLEAGEDELMHDRDKIANHVPCPFPVAPAEVMELRWQRDMLSGSYITAILPDRTFPTTHRSDLQIGHLKSTDWAGAVLFITIYLANPKRYQHERSEQR